MHATPYPSPVMYEKNDMDKDTLVSRVSFHKPDVLPETAKQFAVLLLVVQDKYGMLNLVFPKRAQLITYAGDYCFPGGRKDTQDQNFLVTAMREVKEELNIGEELYQYVGQLNDFQDHEGNLVRPFVALMMKKDFDEHVNVSPDEIADVLFLPLSELNYLIDSRAIENHTRRSPSYVYVKGTVRIWGLTAAIMVHFFNIVFEKNKLVGHVAKK